MQINKLPTALTLASLILFNSEVAIAADFQKGLTAAASGDFKTALAEWTPLAEQGYANSQHYLGIMYAHGDGVLENDKTAVKWFTKAAEQGHARAQTNLGIMYAHGEGVLENDKTAVKWFTKAAEQGYAQAQSNLGVMYEYGTGVLENDKTAVKWYTKAAEQGYAQAQANLGFMYEFGTGVLEDYKTALEWYTKASEQGSDYATSRLSDVLVIVGKDIFAAGIDGHNCSDSIQYFERADELGSSIARTHLELCKTYHRASKGDGEAQYKLAKDLYLGRLIKKNPKAALTWAMKASSNGSDAAESLVGEILINDLVYGNDAQKLRDLAQVIDSVCSKDPKCAFDAVWKHLDISQDGSLSLAELSKFQRDLVQFAYIEEMGDEVEVADAAAINLTGILLLPITSSSILHSFDYNNDGTLQKEEVVGETEFATIVGVDSESLLRGIEFEALGNKISAAMKDLRLPFWL